MSFSQSVKEEVLKSAKKCKSCCAQAFLTGVMKSIGSLCLLSSGYGFAAESDNGALLEFCAGLAKSHFDCQSTMLEIRSAKDTADKSVKYVCRFDVQLGTKLGLVHFDKQEVRIVNTPQVNLSNNCCRRAFMQALFLSCGSVTVPLSEDMFAQSKSNYHLELRFVNEQFANFVAQQFADLQFRTTTRKNVTVLYLKGSDKIADFFVFVGAIGAKFQLEDIIIKRSYRNTANRQRNCIDSNIDKSVAAGSKQLAAIEKLQSRNAYNNLPQQLKEAAEVRQSHPEANLAELAAMLGISKSGFNHRMQKLLDAANALQD